jgi:hypothetical protein
VQTHTQNRIRTTLIGGLYQFYGSGNNTGFPGFANTLSGNLQIGSGSPCVDAGNRLVDIDPFTPGLQTLPFFDLQGGVRVVDGSGSGSAQVDQGAYEVQGQ